MKNKLMKSLDKLLKEGVHIGPISYDSQVFDFITNSAIFPSGYPVLTNN